MSGPARLVATVYLRSASGDSPLAADPRQLRRVERFRAAPETIAAAEAALVSLGFQIEGRGVTLSISGSEASFAEHFGLTRATAGAEARAPRLPESLLPWVEAVALAGPGVPFMGSFG